MIAQPNHTSIASKAVDQFPPILTQRFRTANRAKAVRWWRTRVLFLASMGVDKNKAKYKTSRNPEEVIKKQIGIKALFGRGLPRKEWTIILHGAMFNEFERLRKLGVKFNGSLLQEMALKLLHDNNIPINVSDIEQDTGKPIIEVIT